MIVVHHLNNSRSQRVLWLLEELGLPYEVRHYRRDPRTMLAPPELLQVHPLGKSPVITDGELTLAESGAILEVLAERHGGGRLKPPVGSAAWVRCTYWMHFAEGSAMPPLLMKLVFDSIERKSPALVRPIARAIARKAKALLVEPNLKRHLAYMESELQRTEWFAGDTFSIADIQMSFPVEAASARAETFRDCPRLADFLRRIHARPAYQRALEKGGPFSIV